MKRKIMPKIGTLAVAACLAISAMPVWAAEAKNIEVNFTDITNSATDTLKGEAKVRVSVKGAEGSATIAQMAFDFDGDLKYKKTQFLKGENDPENGGFWTAKADKNNRLTASIISTGGMSFTDNEDVFVITFSGEAGKNVTLKLDDFENTYFMVDGTDIFPNKKQEITLTASDKENVGKSAFVRLAMDNVLDFTGSNDAGITVKITNENQSGDETVVQIDNKSINDGGHRDGTNTTPTFVVENTVIADSTYTVEVSGIGYVTYKKTGVSFNEELKITNNDFIPGDVDNNGKVDKDDKAMVEKFVEDQEYSISADFNRDGKVDKYDLEVFDDIEDNSQSGSNTESGNGTGSENGSDNGSGSGSDSGSGSSSGSGSGGGSGSGSGSGSGGGSSYGGAGVGAITNNKEAFTDLGNHAWAKDSIYTLKNKGIISGVSNTEFAPASNIKRGDFILILTRMLGINNTFTENFADVPTGSYYYNAIGSAKAAGVANGNEGSFMPENSITRQDLITLAYRAFLNKGYITETNDLTVLDTFTDKGSISDYASSAMASMVKAGIIKGSDGQVNPKGFATRAEVAVMCARMLELMK